MSDRHVIEALLRPAVELQSAAVAASAAVVCVMAPWSVALAPSLSFGASVCFGAFAVVRARQGFRILKYRRNLRRLPHYALKSHQIPVSHRRLFLGKGFRWQQRHTQRLLTCLRPEVEHYVNPSALYQAARRVERRFEHQLPMLTRLTASDSRFNPVRPLPPVGGSPLLHGIELDEEEVSTPLSERVGHMLVLGTTRVGKTRLAEVLVTQDIRRGDPTFVLDPKGDPELLIRMYTEAKRVGREFYMFHLGWPELSARYNGIGRFGRITEVASRVTSPLSGEGSSAAFKEFSWRFVNIIAQTLVAMGRRPDYSNIEHYVRNIDELFECYAEYYLAQQAPTQWESIKNLAQLVDPGRLPSHMEGRSQLCVALEQFLSTEEGRLHDDPILSGLRSSVRYDRKYYDKIVASLLPLLEKLTSGKVAQLIAPDYLDMNDSRPIFDWEDAIRKKAVVYVGLDALSDTEVAAAVGNSMFADLVSVAGKIYKHGLGDGLPPGAETGMRVCLHGDEFNELMGDEFIPLINKGGGSGIQVTAYTQTLADIEAKIGNAAKAHQVVGNFNTLVMLRVKEKDTATLLTDQLPEVEVFTTTLISGATDASSQDNDQHFTSNTQDRVSTVRVPMVTPDQVMSLPKGQAFALLEGGQLWKIRMPLPAKEHDPQMPSSLLAVADSMQKHYRTGETWWLSATV